MSEAIASVTTIVVKPGDEPELIRLFGEMRAGVTQLTGVVYFDLYRSRSDNQTFIVCERYESADVQEKFLASALAQTYFPQFRALATDLRIEDYTAL